MVFKEETFARLCSNTKSFLFAFRIKEVIYFVASS